MRTRRLALLTLIGTCVPLACSSSSSKSGGTTDTTSPLTLTVSTGDGAHPISPRIYGINSAAAAAQVKASVVRLGGNPLPAYNWEINATNGGKEEGFANRSLTSSGDAGAGIKDILAAAQTNGGSAMLTIPIGDYVAADTQPGDVHASGANYLTTRFKKNVAAKGSAFSTTPDTTDDSVYEDELVNWVKSNAGSTTVLFGLDNQPELWSEDHAEIHPQQLTYDEVIKRDTSFAKAIKAAWPGVEVTGSVDYGWEGFVNLQNAPDSATDGEFVGYYLDQMKAAESTNGGRLLDYLDLHWWPEAQGGGLRVIVPDANPDVDAARVQAPRSLWDTTYHETSWINDELGNDTIHLIPRMQDEIAQHYPGTKLAVSAWYFGGGGDISGAIATADVLGIFGAYGVDLAALELPEGGGDDSYTFAGMNAFINYDGAGAHFGDTSVKATSSDASAASIYASTDSSDPNHVVIVVLNKNTNDRMANITVNGSANFTSSSVYVLNSSGAKITSAASLAVSKSNANEFDYMMPAMSVSVLVPKQ